MAEAAAQVLPLSTLSASGRKRTLSCGGAGRELAYIGLLPGKAGAQFRAIRTERDGDVSYWGGGDLYSPWGGQALGFDFWD